jgi:hypothetical protein
MKGLRRLGSCDVALRAKKPIDLMRRSLPLIVRAVTDAGVDRLVVVSAFGVGDTAAKASPFAKLIYRTLVAAVFKDKELSEKVLPGSRLNWTIVYPVNLREAPAVPAAVKELSEVAAVPGAACPGHHREGLATAARLTALEGEAAWPVPRHRPHQRWC